MTNTLLFLLSVVLLSIALHKDLCRSCCLPRLGLWLSLCCLIFVTVREKTRYKSEIAILDNAHLKVQTLCYFVLKSDWPNGDIITSVSDTTSLFSAFYSSLSYLSQFR